MDLTTMIQSTPKLEEINKIVNSITNNLPYSAPINKKIESIHNFCFPYKIENIINEKDQYNVPIWFYFLRENEIDLFKYYSEYVKKDSQTLLLFLATENFNDSINLMSWFPKNMFEKTIKNGILEVNNDIMVYAIANNFFKNFNQTIKEISETFINHINKFLNDLANDGSIYIKANTLNTVYNHYYDLTEDITTIENVAQLIIDTEILKINDYNDIPLFTGKFKEVILDKFLKTNIEKLKIPNIDKILKTIIDNNEFNQHKKKIYLLLCNNSTDLLNYAIVKKYFNTEDFISFTENLEYKPEMEEIYLQEKLIKPKNKKIVKL